MTGSIGGQLPGARSVACENEPTTRTLKNQTMIVKGAPGPVLECYAGCRSFVAFVLSVFSGSSYVAQRLAERGVCRTHAVEWAALDRTLLAGPLSG